MRIEKGDRTARLAGLRFQIAVVVLLASVLSVPVLLKSPIPTADSCTYMRVAESIRDGKGPIGMGGKPETRWPVGYPLLIAAIDTIVRNPVLSAKLVSMLSAIAVVPLLLLLARTLFGTEAGFVAGILFALSNYRVKISGIAVSEPSFLLCIVLALLFWTWERTRFQWPRAISIGCLLGYSYVIRPEGLLFGLLLLLLALPVHRLWTTPPWRSYLLTSLGLVVVVAAWVGCVAALTGQWTLTQKTEGTMATCVALGKSDAAWENSFVLNEQGTKIVLAGQTETIPQLLRRMAANAVLEAKHMDRIGSFLLVATMLLGLTLELYRNNRVLRESIPVVAVAGLPLLFLIPLYPAWRYVYTGSAAILILGSWQLMKRFVPPTEWITAFGLRGFTRYAPVVLICLYLFAMDVYTVAHPVPDREPFIRPRAQWLRSHIPPGTRVCAKQIELPYYSGLNWLNLPNGNMERIVPYALHHEVRFIVLTDDIMHFNSGWPQQVRSLLAKGRLQPVGTWHGPDEQTMKVYRISKDNIR